MILRWTGSREMTNNWIKKKILEKEDVKFLQSSELSIFLNFPIFPWNILKKIFPLKFCMFLWEFFSIQKQINKIFTKGKDSTSFFVEIPQKQNLSFGDWITINHETPRKTSYSLKIPSKKHLEDLTGFLSL